MNYKCNLGALKSTSRHTPKLFVATTFVLWSNSQGDNQHLGRQGNLGHFSETKHAGRRLILHFGTCIRKHVNQQISMTSNALCTTSMHRWNCRIDRHFSGPNRAIPLRCVFDSYHTLKIASDAQIFFRYDAKTPLACFEITGQVPRKLP